MDGLNKARREKPLMNASGVHRQRRMLLPGDRSILCLLCFLGLSEDRIRENDCNVLRAAKGNEGDRCINAPEHIFFAAPDGSHRLRERSFQKIGERTLTGGAAFYKANDLRFRTAGQRNMWQHG